MPFDVSTAVPDLDTAAAIRALARDVASVDGAPPLSDQAESLIGSDEPTHVVVSDGGAVVGYAQRDGESVEVVATPEAIDTLLDAVLRAGVRVWSHGVHSRLLPVLEARGLERVRELHQLRRPLDDTHPLPADPPLATGVVVRAFRSGQDDAAWLALNAAAFAGHPEQGGWGQADLTSRMAEDWFDGDDFLLAEQDGSLVGFHWTKVHPDGAGEVYVLGVSPDAQGLGLGSALLIMGLHHLAGRGCPYVLLYVDGDNVSALQLYERRGFARHDLDVQWAQGVS